MNRVKISACHILWSLENVRNGEITVDSNKVTLDKGYYTFKELQTALKKHGIDVKEKQDHHCIVTCDDDSNLGENISILLGFAANEAFTQSVAKTSPSPLNLTNSLKEIYIYLDRLNEEQNYHLSHYSTLLACLPIDTTQTLNGVYSTYSFSPHYQLQCESFVKDQSNFGFYVASGGDINDYNIFLSLCFE